MNSRPATWSRAPSSPRSPDRADGCSWTRGMRWGRALRTASPAWQRSAGVQGSTPPVSRSRCVRLRTTTWAGSRWMGVGAAPCRACGPVARSLPRGCTGLTASPAARFSKHSPTHPGLQMTSQAPQLTLALLRDRNARPPSWEALAPRPCSGRPRFVRSWIGVWGSFGTRRGCGRPSPAWSKRRWPALC